MPYLENEGKRLLSALLPLAAMAERTRKNIDVDDPKAAGKFRFIQELEHAMNAVADYAKAADGLLNPPPDPLTVHVRNLLAFRNDPAPLTKDKLARYFPFPAC